MGSKLTEMTGLERVSVSTAIVLRGSNKDVVSRSSKEELFPLKKTYTANLQLVVSFLFTCYQSAVRVAKWHHKR